MIGCVNIILVSFLVDARGGAIRYTIAVNVLACGCLEWAHDWI
jgi:hypothetical protein